MKVRASTLFVVIVISFLVSCITGSILYLTFYYNMSVSSHASFISMKHNLQSGIILLLSDARTQMHESLDLYGEGSDSVILSCGTWGLYGVGTVEARHHHRTLRRQFLYGNNSLDARKVALHLQNSDRSLYIAGNTILVGDCIVPGGVVKTSISIDGNTYYGPATPVKGQTINADQAELTIHTSRIGEAYRVMDQALGSINNKAGLDEHSGDTLIRSFMDSTLFLNFSEAVGNFSYLEGNIVLYSERSVELHSSHHLKDVIVVAPSVSISDGYQGSLQVFCRDSIVLGQHVRLDYPSSLALLKAQGNNGEAYISLEDYSTVVGDVFAYSFLPKDNQLSIKIKKKAKVNGQVYSAGGVVLEGTVHGEVAANYLLYKGNKNYVLNGTIDVSKRFPGYVASCILSSSGKKRIVKWL